MQRVSAVISYRCKKKWNFVSKVMNYTKNVKVALEQATMAQRESRGIAILVL
jgi:hypothetical protein